MFTRTDRRRFSISASITRRWIRSRPGSVLILVIALLVLLALIGTAYLSSTQTERYTSVQNTINTEADLLIQGLDVFVNSTIVNGLFGANQQYRPPSSEMPTYDAAGTVKTVEPTGYYNYDSTVTDPYLPVSAVANPPDLFLGDRIPSYVFPNATYPSAYTGVLWNGVSWPLFSNSSNSFSFDSPFDDSVDAFSALNKGKITAIPTYRTVGETTYPALLFWVPSTGTLPTKLRVPNGTIQEYNGSTSTPGLVTSGEYTVARPGGYLTPHGIYYITSGPLPAPTSPLFGNYAIVAANASGDGISDAPLFKLPVGQINGITYYGAIRVVDGNSAVNASSAWTQGVDAPFGTNPATNFGFFRSNIGLAELLYPVSTTEMTGLNNKRFPSSLSATPKADTSYSSPPTNFSWFSQSDEIENQLTRRPGLPGYDAGGNQFAWLGQSTTAALAYKYLLKNTSASSTTLETQLAYELININTGVSPIVPTTPYSPAQVNNWFAANFNYFASYNGTNGAGSVGSPLRTLLVGNNAVSNAVPARYGNMTATTPTAWTAGKNYNFGDWVVDGPPGNQRSFVCIRQHLGASVANEPEPGPYPPAPGAAVYYNPGAVAYWAGAQGSAPASPNEPDPGMPWSVLPGKTSINTASFEQLWLGFAQVMTDSIGPDLYTVVAGAQSQWQPPMLTTGPTPTGEQQLPMFRSTIRDPASPVGAPGRIRLTSSQMLKLRAALAAVNTIDLRDSDDTVTSRHIVLTDAAGGPQYDVEVYGTEKQPYISEVVIQTDGTVAGTYVALELCNPYSTPIVMGDPAGTPTPVGWQIGSLLRPTTLSSTTGMSLSPGLAIPPGTTIPAAVGGAPGILILEDGVRPTDVGTTITTNMTHNPPPMIVALGGLKSAAINGGEPCEVFVMRPRQGNATGGMSSKSLATADDQYDESDPDKPTPGPGIPGLADFVPIDQIDLTGLTIPTGGPFTRFLYRRGSDDTATPNGKAWQFVYPGVYEWFKTTASTIGRYYTNSNENAAAIVTDTTDSLPCNLGAGDGGAVAGTETTYPTAPLVLNNTFMAGPNPAAAVANTFPYGRFARNLDMLQIPFIGSYRIRNYASPQVETNVFLELNSVTMDAALATDTSPGMVANVNAQPTRTAGIGAVPPTFNEQIGRFCPIGDPNGATPLDQMDFGPGYDTSIVGGPTDKIYWHYHWAKRLFDYFTVQSPADDYFPDVDPSQGDATVTPAIPPKYIDPLGGVPAPVNNNNTTIINSQTAGKSEDTLGVEGLININTAPAAVLAQLPFLGTSGLAAPLQLSGNAAVAQAIVADRNANGPFQSIFDLYRVTAFRNTFNTAMHLDTTQAGPQQGLFSPGGIGAAAAASPGQTRFDFQEQFLQLNNISNLITTRSDTFTCYILLQGWRNVGTGNPSLAVQRRAAFLLDRNAVAPSNNQASIFNIPTN